MAQLAAGYSPAARALGAALGVGEHVTEFSVSIKANECVTLYTTRILTEDEVSMLATTFKQFELKEKE